MQRLGHISVVMVAVAFAACGPRAGDPIPMDAADRYAAAMCATLERCDCARETFDAQEECEAHGRELFRKIASWPEVQFDAECFEKMLSYIEKDECTGPLDADKSTLPCVTFSGGLGGGASCPAEWEGPWPGYGGLASSPCTNGSFCYGRTCRLPPAPQVELGEPCALELGVSCGQGRYCGSDGRCRQRVGAGEPCDTPMACMNSDEYCEGLGAGDGVTGTCMPRIAVGASCDPQEVGACAESPTSYCSREGTCMRQWPTVCEAVAPRPDEYIASEWIPIQ